jgi:hypothetical protein
MQPKIERMSRHDPSISGDEFQIGCFRGGCHSDLYRPNAEHFLFRFMRTSRRNAFRSLVRNSRYCTNASRDSASKLARRDRQHFDSATWLHKARVAPKEEFKQEVERELTEWQNGTVGDYLLQTVPEPGASHRAGD